MGWQTHRRRYAAMAFGMTYYQICWYFLIYSFLGWITEVIYQAVSKGRVINRGFLNGPVCPVYGCGILAVFSFVGIMEESGREVNDLELFLFGMLLATAVELFAGWLLDALFHARWWDYSSQPFNFRGYICLKFSILWGMAVLLVVRIFQAYVEHRTVSRIPEHWGWIALAALYAVFFTDLAVTVAIIVGFNKKLRSLDQMQADLRIVSDRLSEDVGTKSLETAQRVGEARVQAALGRAELKDAMEERKEALQARMEELYSGLASHRVFGYGRLLRAFPDLQHREFTEIVQKLKERLREAED
jgi:uncharacterized membrane protein